MTSFGHDKAGSRSGDFGSIAIDAKRPELGAPSANFVPVDVLLSPELKLQAYQVGDNDIVAAYDPAGAIEVLKKASDGDYDDLEPERDVFIVSDKWLDATEVFDQDEGKLVPMEKTLRTQLAEITEPQHMWGWE